MTCGHLFPEHCECPRTPITAFPAQRKRTAEEVQADIAANQARLDAIIQAQKAATRPTSIELAAMNKAAEKAAAVEERRRITGHVTVAQQYIQQHAMLGGEVTLRRWRGSWYRWTRERGCYRGISDEQLEADLYRRAGVEGLGKRQDVTEVRHALIAVDGVLIDDTEIGEWIGVAPAGIDARDVAVCPNGLVHLPTGRAIAATPCFFSTNALGVVHAADAPAPARWLAFLESLWPDDAESIATLQEWLGYQLTRDTRQQKIALVVGPKRSGKGTIARVMAALLGADSIASPTLASLGSNFGLQPLIGRSAAIIGDARLSARSDISQIVERLLSISGQDSITIDRKHRDAWTGPLSTRITLISNELPRFTDASAVIASRFLVLQLTQSWYGREDTSLTDALLDELPGILQWAIDGWRRMRARGRFEQPSASAAVTDEIADLASPVGAWVRACCVRGGDLVVPCSVAYEAFKAWCVREGMTAIPTSATFGRDLRAAAGCERCQRRVDGRAVGHYTSIALTSG